MDILKRVGRIEIIESVQRVCSTWWNVCHNPTMWRVVHLKYEPEDSNTRPPKVLDRICRIAVDRSRGQLVELSIQNFGDKELLNYVAQRSSQLRVLRLVKGFGNFAGGFVLAANNFPLLEELHIHFTFITKEDIQSVGRSCPLLKSFILNASGRCYSLLKSFLLNVSGCDKLVLSPSQCDDQALAIAISMPELRHLSLVENTLTNSGLEAILDGCSRLESLDLRRCYNIYLVGELGKRCRQQIVDLKQPHASTHDYEFDSEVWHYLSSDDDYDDYFFHVSYRDQYGDDDDYFIYD